LLKQAKGAQADRATSLAAEPAEIDRHR